MLYNITIVLCLKISAPASCTEDQYNCLFMRFKKGVIEAKIEANGSRSFEVPQQKFQKFM